MKNKNENVKELEAERDALQKKVEEVIGECEQIVEFYHDRSRHDYGLERGKYDLSRDILKILRRK